MASQQEKFFGKGTVLPTTCKVGDMFMLIDRSGPVATLFICLADNVWTAAIGNDLVNGSPAVSL
jgi:hypothetical protein